MPARPTHLSKIPRGTDISVAERGATLLGMDLKPQGRQVASLMEARRGERFLYGRVVVQMSRRTTKTTSIWSTLLGRCAEIPGYRVVTTAQDGTRAGEKIREHMEILEGRGFEEVGPEGEPPLGSLFWSNGKERIKFANGSMLWTVAPKPGAFRSAAADALLFDEAGELEPEHGELLLAGALPLGDSRPNRQIIITGTPGLARAGLLWNKLEDGRRGKRGTGVLDYSARDDEPTTFVDDGTYPKSWARKELRDGTVLVLNEPLLRRVHPGVGNITTIDVMRENFEEMQEPQFRREYMGGWPADSTTHAIDPAKWEAALVERVPLPERVGVAFDCAADGGSASMVYAWRDEDGVAYLDVVAHRAGTSWVPRAAADVRRHYPRVPMGYDGIGANLDPAAAIAREHRAAKFERMGLKEIAAATQRFVSLVSEGKVRHFGQSDLDAAVDNATFRDLAGGRAFRKREVMGAAINPLVAATVALWTYDKGRDRQPLTIAM